METVTDQFLFQRDHTKRYRNPDKSRNYAMKKSMEHSVEYNNIQQELYDSEETYLSYLYVIQEVFIKPITTGKIASAADIRSLFGEIESISNVSQELLYLLQSKDTVSEAFAYLGPFLKLYSAYAKNYTSSQKTFNRLMCRTIFRDKIEQQELDISCNGIKFSALMIMPIQRIPRYILLLQRLSAETQMEDEKTQLKAVLDEMSKLTGLIESCIADFEEGERLWTIQESLGLKEDIVVPGRRLIKEGVLYKRSHCGETSYHERMFWLFNDALVYGKRRMGMGPRYECSCLFPLRPVVLNYNEIEGSLLIKCKSHSILVTSDSYDNLQSWNNVIKEAVERNRLLRATLRKESSRLQVKEYKSKIKKRLTNKIINKTYLYDMSQWKNPVASARKKMRNVVRSAPDEDYIQGRQDTRLSGRKRKNDSAFDEELRVAVSKRACEVEPNHGPAEQLLIFRNNEKNKDDVGYDMEDRKPRTVSRSRELVQLKAQRESRTLTRPEIRKFSYQDLSVPTIPEASSLENSFDEEKEDDMFPPPSQNKSPPWWVVESTPAEFARQREKKSFTDRIKESCSLM